MLQHFYVICNIVNFVDMELSAGVIKWVHSLSQKKNRDKERCFVAEGTKCVIDTLDYFKVRYLFATSDWAYSVGCRLRCPVTVATKAQIERMSMLKTATDVIAVYEMPDVQIEKGLEKRLALVLDGIQDPGNFGTILRIADWFGVKDVFCSKGTVDVYNPKTVQATMGAISRVNVVYCNLPELLASHKDMPVYGTLLDGNNIYETPLAQAGFIVMGNEGKGISEEIRRLVTGKLLIPSYPIGTPTSESLNVGMATAIVVAEFRRRTM